MRAPSGPAGGQEREAWCPSGPAGGQEREA